jgi:hypothetical protein
MIKTATYGTRGSKMVRCCLAELQTDLRPQLA